jgi:CheY-like chemotaxis protein
MVNTGYRFNKIMLIDDNDIDNFINKEVIERSYFSAEVSVNNSADLALESLRHLSGQDRTLQVPEVIFVDLDMPVKDGFEFIREFMLLSGDVGKLAQLVVLTSSVDPLHERRVLAMSKHIKFLQKPLTSKKLQQL